jgi:hypothetical protein
MNILCCSPYITNIIYWTRAAGRVEGIQKLLNPQYDNIAYKEEVTASSIIDNPATQKHFKPKIKTLRYALKDRDKLGELFKRKQRQQRVISYNRNSKSKGNDGGVTPF